MKIIIAAMGYNRVIGVDGAMPWWIPEEYQMFLNFITDQSVIFGRSTYGYFSKDLPAKRVYVVTHQNINYEDAVVCHSLEEALDKAGQHPEEVYIAGGGAIYAQAMDLADKMYLSYIKGEYEGDTFFPEFDKTEWKEEKRVDYPKYEFVIYSRRSAD